VSEGLTAEVNVPWWSLTTEVHFYLLVPLVAPLLRHRLLRWVLLAGACVLSAWWWDQGAYATELSASLLPGRLPQFLMGAMVGVALRERGASVLTWSLAASRWVGRAAVAGLVALGLYLGANGTFHRHDVGFDMWIEPLSGLLLGVLLLHLVVRSEQGHRLALEHPAVRGAGLVSYSLYLWHYPILVAALAWFGVAESPVMAVVAIPVAFVACALATAASYRWIERPLLYRPPRPLTAPQPQLVRSAF
jgi:peptidoglycan/LPS O-acetylase OafA/YrhL